jgi:hypothetical protein
MSRMPTLLIGIWRVSARLCTSSTGSTWALGAAAMVIEEACELKKPAQFAGFRDGFNPSMGGRTGNWAVSGPAR